MLPKATANTEEAICACRRETGWGPRLGAGATGFAHSTVWKVLRRAGISRPPRAAREPTNRYEWPCPGDLLHMDVSRYARFRRPGHRVTGDRSQRWRNWMRPETRVGYDYAHAIVDDHSRLAYVELHDDEKAATVTAFVERALAFFAEYGIAAKRLMTDNGFSYVKNPRSASPATARMMLRAIDPRGNCCTVSGFMRSGTTWFTQIRGRGQMATIEESIEVDVPVSTAYNQWTQFEEFPTFMDGVDQVRQLDDTHLHWKASHGGQEHEWDAEITEQKPDERVAWKSTDGKNNAGVVTFHRLSDQRTKIMVQMDWEPEGAVEKVGGMLGSDDRRVKGDLERFKEMIEARGTETGAWRGEVN